MTTKQLMILTVLSLTTATAQAQVVSSKEALDTMVVIDAPADSFVTIDQPVTAQLLWDYVRQCSGAPVQPGGDLKDVTWLYGPLRRYDPKHLIVAHWDMPGTILLDNSFPLYNVVVAHELLHHLLRGPGGSLIEAHPEVFERCKLMPSQYLDILSTSAAR
jgi:hypothetical protein